jgi:hypothetical protein
MLKCARNFSKEAIRTETSVINLLSFLHEIEPGDRTADDAKQSAIAD